MCYLSSENKDADQLRGTAKLICVFVFACAKAFFLITRLIFASLLFQSITFIFISTGSEASVEKQPPAFPIPDERPRVIAWTISLSPTGREDEQYSVSEIPLHMEDFMGGNNSRQTNTSTTGKWFFVIKTFENNTVWVSLSRCVEKLTKCPFHTMNT